jgi:protein arginine N-methyltransferase 1
MRIEYHRTLVADRVRNAAFHAALKVVITPGETVVADVGAGTGLLALMAAKLGAKDVFLYEAAEVAGVAAEILKANRVRNCHLFPCHSTEMDDPPRVDVVVSETLGNYAFEENIADTLGDARRRFLSPGGVIIPARLEQLVAPVIVPRIHHELCAWDEVGYDLDLTFGRTMSLNNAYVRTIAPGELLDGGKTAQAWDRADFGRAVRPNRRGEASWLLRAPTVAYGFACWWTAELVPGVLLSTGPGAPRTHWEQLYLPLLRPLQAGAGETIRVSLRSRSSREGGTHLAWTALQLDASGDLIDRQALDLDRGYLP